MSRPVVEIRPVEPGDIEWFAVNLRPQDVAEARASGFDDLAQGLRRSVSEAVFARVALINGERVAIGGCGEWAQSALVVNGVPWLVGTPGLTRHGRVLQREARRYIGAMLERYPRLINLVHADNRVAIRWLQRMGFVIHAQSVPYGPHNAPFHFFEMRA